MPIIGLIYSDILSGHYIFVYLAYLSVPIVYWIVFKTSFGLRVRAVGENPSESEVKVALFLLLGKFSTQVEFRT